MDIQAEEPEDEFPLNHPDPEDCPLSDGSEGVTMVFEPTVSNPVPAEMCIRDRLLTGFYFLN